MNKSKELLELDKLIYSIIERRYKELQERHYELTTELQIIEEQL